MLRDAPIRSWLLCLSAALALVVSTHASGQPFPRPAEDARIEGRLPEKRVLLLHSYTARARYTRVQDTAIREGVARGYPGNVNFFTSELDFNLGEDMESWSSVHEFLKLRYSTRSLDLIIATDTPALRFLQHYGPETFPGVPIVFSASKEAPAGNLREQCEITGVVETVNVRGTIELILRLHPGTRRLLMINNSSVHGLELREKTLEALASMGSPLEVEWFQDLGFDDVAARLRTATDDAAVLFLTYWDLSGKRATLDGTLGEFARVCPRPIYVLFDTYIGFGAMGGRVASAEAYGDAAALMSVRILKGEHASDIPMVASVNPTLLDARQLERFKVSAESIPKDAEIRFDEPTFAERNASIIAFASAIAIVQGAIIGWLVLSLRKLKKAKRALQASEARFRALGEHLPGMPYSTIRRPDGKRVAEYLGPGLESLVGNDAASLIRADFDRFFDYVHPDDHPRIAEDRTASTSQNRPFECEYRLKAGDGRWRWVRANALPTLQSSGAIRWHGVLLDIDIAKRAEIALRASEEQFRALGENLPGLAFTTYAAKGQQRIAEYLGPGLEHLLGEKNAAIVRKNIDLFPTFIHPEDQPRAFADREEALQQRRPFDGEYRLLAPDGSWRWIRSTARPTFFNDGAIRWHGVVLDISEAKNAEEALIRRDRILHAVAEAGRRLAQADHVADAMTEAVRLFGSAAGADRAYLFERHSDPEIGMVSRMTAEWADAGVPSQIHDPRFSYLADSDLDRARRLAPLARGETIVRAASECTGPEREFFDIQNLKTIVVVPVLLGTRWWGFLGFDACRQASPWSPVEIDALRTAANAIAASLERSEREARLRLSEEQYRLVFEATNDVMWDWDLASNQVKWSPSLGPTFGIGGDGLISDVPEYLARVHPDDVQRLTDAIGRFLAGEMVSWRDEYRFRRTDGVYAWVTDRASLVRDKSGKAARVIGAMTDVTSLRDTERRLRVALEAGSMATWEWDLDAQVIHHSDGLGPMFNLPPGAGPTAQGLVVEQIIPEDRPVKLRAVAAAFDRADGALSVDYRVGRPDGSIRWLSCQGRAVQDEGGSNRRLFGVTIDITQMKNAESALRESEERYRRVVEALPVGVLVHDGESLYFANESTRSMFRADSLERILQTTFASLVHPDHHPGMPERIRLILEENRHLDPFEIRVVAFDGAVVHAEIQCSPTLFSGKKLIQTTILDLTERRRAELALRESEERFRQITDNAGEVFWLTDVGSHSVRYISPAFEQVWGMPREPVLRDSSAFYSTIHPDDRNRVERLARGNATGYDLEFRIIRPDGTIRWVRDRAYPVRDASGRTVRIAGVAQDITDAKAAEEAIQRTTLTQQLLLGELDHRVKNSLSGLLTLIDLTRAATDEIETFADSIRARVLAMASVHTLLSEGHWSPVSMDRLVRSLRPSEAVGSVEFDGAPIDVPARQVTALAMIVQELFTNSMKHGAASRHGGIVEIRWSIESQPRPAGTLELNLDWTESGGPLISLPVSPGVGTRLIQGFCKFELNGVGHFHYAPEGVAHQFKFHLDTHPAPLPDVKLLATHPAKSPNRLPLDRHPRR